VRNDRGVRPRHALEDGIFVRLGQSKLVMIEHWELLCVVVRISISGRSVNC